MSEWFDCEVVSRGCILLTLVLCHAAIQSSSSAMLVKRFLIQSDHEVLQSSREKDGLILKRGPCLSRLFRPRWDASCLSFDLIGQYEGDASPGPPGREIS